jgi:hypothetical protein
MDKNVIVYGATGKPAGVPAENWLPSKRVDEGMDVILRVYVPELYKIINWNAPSAQKI